MVVVVVAAVPPVPDRRLEEVECKAKAMVVLQAEVFCLVGWVHHLLSMVVVVVVPVVGVAMVLLWLVVWWVVVVPGVAMVVVVCKATLMAQCPRMRGEEEEGVRVVITLLTLAFHLAFNMEWVEVV